MSSAEAREGQARAAAQAQRQGHRLGRWRVEHDLAGLPPGPVQVATCLNCGGAVYVHPSHCSGTVLTLNCTPA